MSDVIKLPVAGQYEGLLQDARELKLMERSILDSSPGTPLSGLHSSEGPITHQEIALIYAFLGNPNESTWAAVKPIEIVSGVTVENAWRKHKLFVISDDIPDPAVIFGLLQAEAKSRHQKVVEKLSLVRRKITMIENMTAAQMGLDND